MTREWSRSNSPSFAPKKASSRSISVELPVPPRAKESVVEVNKRRTAGDLVVVVLLGHGGVGGAMKD
jgi:hypothetical protein